MMSSTVNPRSERWIFRYATVGSAAVWFAGLVAIIAVAINPGWMTSAQWAIAAIFVLYLIGGGVLIAQLYNGS